MNVKKLEFPLNFDNWTERASSAGKLNTNLAGKTPMQKYEDAKAKIQELELKDKLIASQQKTLSDLKAELPNLKARKSEIILSETAKTHLKEIYWETRTGVRKDIHSKYFENGKLGEESGISLISQLDDPDLFDMGMPIYSKCNLPRVFGSHFQGECDIKHSPSIQDIKCCWDIFTFYPHVDELVIGEDGKSKWLLGEDGVWRLPKDNIENDDYECQGIVYMELYGESEFLLRYVLVNMPDVLLEQQYKWILKEYGGKESDAYYAACAEFKKKHTFDHLPIEARVATFKIERDNEKYLDLCRRVEKAREFLNWYSEEMFYFENPSLRPKSKFNIVTELVSFKIETNNSDENKILVQYSENSTEQERKDIINSAKQVYPNGNFVESFVSEFSNPLRKNPIMVESNSENLEKIISNEEAFWLGANPNPNEEKIQPIEHTIGGVGIDRKSGYEVELERIKNGEISGIDGSVIKKDETGFEEITKDVIFINPTSINEDFKNAEIEIGENETGFEELKKSFIEELNNSGIPTTGFDEPNTESISNPISNSDSFLISIQNLKTIDDAVSFYMENSSKIDDTQYEEIYFKKKDELSGTIEAPKVKKSVPISTATAPVKSYTGNERYNISDGFKDIAKELTFDSAKNFILEYTKSKFPEWNELKLHRDGITTFVMANRELIERDSAFKDELASLSKEECKKLVDKAREEMLKQVSKM